MFSPKKEQHNAFYQNLDDNVISTHSDYVIDKLTPENVVLVRKTKESGTVASSLPKSLSRNDFRALKEYLSESGNLGEYWKEGGFENE